MQNLINKISELKSDNKQIKLHLGCGPHILDGWVNIEGEYMKNVPNIFIHDITQPFQIDDNTVDEILTVHVIEHIMPYDVDSMMQEWLRILKPSGFVAIEWPDLLKMCKFIVDDPSRIYNTNKKIQKRAVAGIYGNIAKYQDVAMLHKWGYSADSLSYRFKENGFKETSIETPMFQKTEMDSRVVAYK